jgi:hypothetical protein
MSAMDTHSKKNLGWAEISKVGENVVMMQQTTCKGTRRMSRKSTSFVLLIIPLVFTHEYADSECKGMDTEKILGLSRRIS